MDEFVSLLRSLIFFCDVRFYKHFAPTELPLDTFTMIG